MSPRRAKPGSETRDQPNSAALQRQQMIAVAAYYRAENRGFSGGDADTDWLEAEAEIDRISQPAAAPGAGAKQVFQQKLEAQLAEWDGNLEDFKLRAKELKAKTRSEFEKQFEALAGKRSELRERLQQLASRSEGAWEDLKEGSERVLAEMRETVERIAAKFK